MAHDFDINKILGIGNEAHAHAIAERALASAREDELSDVEMRELQDAIDFSNGKQMGHLVKSRAWAKFLIALRQTPRATDQ